MSSSGEMSRYILDDSDSCEVNRAMLSMRITKMIKFRAGKENDYSTKQFPIF